MAKILLVEDDNNLREIYEARLMAEGYDIVSARDGEEALTVAMKEKPDLVISDVMMPKISGFDMLDILRTTEETKNIKIIMMTALSQAEDKARAEKLGADRYLVKSQVTLEDVAKVAKEVLEGAPTPEANSAPSSPAPAVQSATIPAPAPEPVVAVPVASPEPSVQAPQPTPSEPTTVPAPASIPAPAPAPVVAAPAPAVAPAPVTANPVSTTAQSEEEAIAQQIEGMMAQNAAAQSTAIPTAPLQPQSTPVPAEPAFIATPTQQAAVPAAVEDPNSAETVVINEEPSSAPFMSSTQENQELVASAPEPQASPNSSTKRVIEPFSDPSAPTKTNINDLIAQENSNEAAAQAGQGLPVQPAPTTIQPTVVAPQAPQPQNPATPSQNNVDPNSIAL